MRRRWQTIWCAVLLGGACATPARPTVSEQQLTRIPAAERKTLIEGETDVRVAQSNQAAANTALRDARQFRDIVKREVDAATSRVGAARSGVELGQKAGDDSLSVEARRELRLGEAQLRTARAKRTYADGLVALRESQVARWRAEVDAARARQELAEHDALQRHGKGQQADRGRFVDAMQSTRARADMARREVAKQKAEMEAARSRWYARRDELDSVRAEVRRGNMRPPPAPTPVPE